MFWRINPVIGVEPLFVLYGKFGPRGINGCVMDKKDQGQVSQTSLKAIFENWMSWRRSYQSRVEPVKDGDHWIHQFSK